MRTTRTVTALAIVTLASAAALSAGCSIEPGAPDEPTYEAAVRPILMSHCVRCHGDPQQGDPTSDLLPPDNKGMYPVDYLRNPPGQPPTAPRRFDKFEDTNCDAVDGGASSSCFLGAGSSARLIGAYVGPDAPLPMPPPPATPLTNHQRDTIMRWAAETPPLER